MFNAIIRIILLCFLTSMLLSWGQLFDIIYKRRANNKRITGWKDHFMIGEKTWK